MSVADRLAHVNLAVESFLKAHNAAHLVESWHELAVQHTLFEGLGLTDAESWKRPQLKVVFGNTVRGVSPHIQKVLLGADAATRQTNDTVQVMLPNSLPVHVSIERYGKRQWKICAVGVTWVRVGTHLPSSLLLQPLSTMFDRPGVVLQRTSVFMVGSHVFEVVTAPSLLPRHHGKFLAAGTRSPLESTTVATVAAEIEESDSATCVIQCISPHASPVFQRHWVLQYGKGNIVWQVGTSQHASIGLPPADEKIAAQHCHIQALMGYFWLLDAWSAAGTYVQQHAGSEPWVLQTGDDQAVHLMVAQTPVTLLLN